MQDKKKLKESKEVGGVRDMCVCVSLSGSGFLA